MSLPKLWLLTLELETVRRGVQEFLHDSLGRRYQNIIFKFRGQIPDQSFVLIFCPRPPTNRQRVLTAATAKQPLRQLSHKQKLSGKMYRRDDILV